MEHISCEVDENTVERPPYSIPLANISTKK